MKSSRVVPLPRRATAQLESEIVSKSLVNKRIEGSDSSSPPRKNERSWFNKIFGKKTDVETQKAELWERKQADLWDRAARKAKELEGAGKAVTFFERYNELCHQCTSGSSALNKKLRNAWNKLAREYDMTPELTGPVVHLLRQKMADVKRAKSINNDSTPSERPAVPILGNSVSTNTIPTGNGISALSGEEIAALRKLDEEEILGDIYADLRRTASSRDEAFHLALTASKKVFPHASDAEIFAKLWRIAQDKPTSAPDDSNLNRGQPNVETPPVRSDRNVSTERMSPDEIQWLRQSYVESRPNAYDAEEAFVLAVSAFEDMFPDISEAAIEQQLTKIVQEEERQRKQPVATYGPAHGDVVVEDWTQVYCGIASPYAVDPGQFFYRERQDDPYTCGQHALNAMVGSNVFDMRYIEEVKYSVLAQRMGLSVDGIKEMERASTIDIGGQDPVILAECLRRKAHAGEIDPKWKNAQAHYSVEVDDTLWAELEEKKFNGVIIGYTDVSNNLSHYVTQRTDSAGQDRILNSVSTEEIHQTAREYIEARLPAMGADQNGKRRIHLITC